MPKPYTLAPERRMDFSILFLLEYIENRGDLFVLLEGDFTLLDSIIREAHKRGLIDVRGLAYTLSNKGRKALKTFMARFSDFIARYDVFHSVDLTKGEFAMAKYWDMEPEEYVVYLQEDRWEDLRVAVAEYSKLDPLEIVFMSFLNEGRFDAEKPGWQFEIALGTAWNEIEQICSTNLQAQDLGAQYPWEEVIKDIITQGNDLMVRLLQQEQELRRQGKLNPVYVPTQDEITITVVTEVTYYDDPFYVYDFWYDPYW